MCWPIAATNYLNLSSQTVKLLVVLLSKDTFAAHCPLLVLSQQNFLRLLLGMRYLESFVSKRHF